MGSQPWFLIMFVLAGGVLLGTLPVALLFRLRPESRLLPARRVPPSPPAEPGADARRIFAYLHDETVQSLAGSLNNLRLALRVLGENHPASRFVADSEKLTYAGISSIRQLLVSLRTGNFYDHSLATNVQAVLGRLSHTAPMDVHLAALPDLSAFPATEEVVAGIIGEAVTNAAKHAQARNVWVDVLFSKGRANVVVRDDGVGFDPQSAEREAEARRSFGLYLLRERVRSVGGTVSITSRVNDGTTVEADLPLRRDVTSTPPPLPLWLPDETSGPRISH